MSTMSPIMYMYGLNLKFKYIPKGTGVSDIFPNVEDFVLQSKRFETFEAAVSSAKGLVTDVMEHINEIAPENAKYKQITELNPVHGGQPTISKEWARNEIAKLWIIPAEADLTGTTPVVAIGMAQVVEVESDPVLVC